MAFYGFIGGHLICIKIEFHIQICMSPYDFIMRHKV